MKTDHPIASAAEINSELLVAMKWAVEVIHLWHDFYSAKPDKAQWDNYYKNSPEMKPIREAIEKAEGKNINCLPLSRSEK
jgi:hypothetical protein